MKKLILLFTFFTIANLLTAQCTVDLISAYPCEDNALYMYPIHVEYTGTPSEVQIEVSGLSYAFQPQKMRSFQHFNNPSNTNSFDFMVYNVDDGAQDNITVTVSLLGNACAGQNLAQSLILDDPACFCPVFYDLAGTLDASAEYYASDYIETEQTVTAGNDVIYSAINSVTLEPNFTLELGATMTTNNTGCTIN